MAKGKKKLSYSTGYRELPSTTTLTALTSHGGQFDSIAIYLLFVLFSETMHFFKVPNVDNVIGIAIGENPPKMKCKLQSGRFPRPNLK